MFLKFSRNSQVNTWARVCAKTLVSPMSGLRPATLLKKRLWHRCFPVNFAKFSKYLFTEHFRMTASESTFYILVALLLCLLVSTKSDDVQWPLSLPHNFHRSLREKCPNAEFFQVCIFQHSDWIRRLTEPISIFSPNTGKYGPKKTPYWDTFQVWISNLYS